MIDEMLTVDRNGFVAALSLRQLQNKLVADVYARDRSSDKDFAKRELGLVYWVGDFKSPANQSGMSFDEAIQDAIENYGLPSTYKPDNVILSLIAQYRERYVYGAAGSAVMACLKGLRLCSIVCSKLSDQLNEYVSTGGCDVDQLESVTDTMTSIMKISKDLPSNIKALNDAEEALKYQIETQKAAYGGKRVSKSMDPTGYLGG